MLFWAIAICSVTSWAMTGVGEAACDEDGLGAWTVMTDCSLRGGETSFPLRGWGAIIEECNVKTKNEGVMWV
jgi:hypothetical protein